MPTYKIINADAIQERIDKLEDSYIYYLKIDDTVTCQILSNTIGELEEILSNSIDLIPEIEKAFDGGSETPKLSGSYPAFDTSKKQEAAKQEYINNFKLEI